MRRFLGWICVLLAGLAAVARAGEPALPAVTRITWLAGDAVSSADGSQVVRPSDRMIDWLAARLPQIEHVRVTANAKRSWMLIESGEPVCHAGAVRLPERERQAYFTNTRLLPPLQLIARSELRGRLPVDASGQVDLPRLLADPRLRGVRVQGRSYGAQIDALLMRQPLSAEVTTGDFGSNVLPMLLRGHADYAIEYPFMVDVLAKRRPELGQLAMLPIRGVSDMVVGGVACSRTPWGLAAIRLIDRELGTPEGAAMLRNGLMPRLSAEDQRAYREQIDAFFMRRSQPTPGL